MQPSDLKREIKQLLITELNLAGRDPSSIDDEAPLLVETRAGGPGAGPLPALPVAAVSGTRPAPHHGADPRRKRPELERRRGAALRRGARRRSRARLPRCPADC